ncbi:MAG: hypothetical protein GTO42_01805 [Candidatus Latescibacteria bacterium]|nr:hypothetical protein [Candidatus Latescibacterota bacterium]NIO27266.1 hypothetical protein [Candidatus Latescibacterota bacterium]NIO54790.1 hypothetical protein [Candidatus Latescibacterota bacterium]NIT00873.1 hypothetical protein [Candidatus Latescibacterota bacterium]NIT37796.1 hypothetical protein [Candidatus Latescibacterota bacterium]
MFFLTLFVWHYLGLSHPYHSIVAGVLNIIYPMIESTNLIGGIHSEGSSFVIDLIYKGKSVGSLNIVGEDITSNTAMLLALYAASPIRIHLRKFVAFFIASLLILFFVHCLTLATMIQYSLIINPEIMRRYSFKVFTIKAVDAYIYFYEIIGMYLIILAIWFPYIIICAAEAKRRRKAHGEPQ